MINVVALCLVVTSLVSAGVWSPTAPQTGHDDRDMIVKEGHRVVVVEFDPEKPITKVSISPETDVFPRRGVNSDVDAMLEGENLSEPRDGDGGGSGEHWRSPRELVCDAYGKCKHKIVDAIGKTKETVSEAAHEARHGAEEAVEEVKNATARADETLCEATQEAAHEVAEKARGAVHHAEEAFDRAKGSVQRGAAEAYKRARSGARHHHMAAHDAGERARGAAKETKDVGKTIGVDVAKNLSSWAERFPGEAATLLPHPVSGVAHIVAFSTAYGTGLWVTFVLSHVLARALPRQQFGMVQSKVYPVYFRVMAASIGATLLCFLASHERKVLSRSPEMFQAFNLLASLAVVLLNMFFLEPKATKVMLEKMKAEKEEGRGEGEEPSDRPETQAAPASGGVTEATRGAPAEQEGGGRRVSSLSGRLKTLNTLSSILNILSLMALSCHVYYLGNSLLLHSPSTTTHD